MSLWNMPLRDVAFTDIDAFCKIGHAEGLQLDYKSEVPKELAKTVAAFANTRGGLLLLGVDADKQANKPIWPYGGMDADEGLSEQIVAKCRDGIYPPVIPETSSFIANPSDATKGYMVVRVDESPRAPHSIKNGKYIYERTGDMNNPIDYAHIDRVALLLERRKAPESYREFLVNRHLTRYLGNKPVGDTPFFWWCVLPEYPHGSIFSYLNCQTATIGGGSQRVPDGHAELGTLDRCGDWIYSSAGKHGDIFYARKFWWPSNEGDVNPATKSNEPSLDPEFLANATYTFLLTCQTSYYRHAIYHPGLLRVCIGAGAVKGLCLKSPHSRKSGVPFIDNELRLDKTVRLEELYDDNSRSDIAYSFAEELFHSFGLDRPNPRSVWQAVAL